MEWSLDKINESQPLPQVDESFESQVRKNVAMAKSSKVMAYTYLVPSWVALWEVALGHGAPPLLVLVGVVLTAVALVLLLKEE